jgi:WD40 repeat protein
MTDNAVRVNAATHDTNLNNNSAPSHRVNMNGHAASQAETSAQETRDHSPRAELKIDDFEVLGDSRAKKGNRTAPEPTPPPSSDTAADQSRDSSDSNTSRTSTDSSASLVESKNRTVARNVASDVKVKRYFKAPEGTWHMLDLDTGRSAIDIPKKEVPEREPESKNSTLTMPRTTSGKFTTINGNHTVPDRAINRNPPNSVHVTSHDALYFVHERDARATWIYSLSGPPTNQSANSVSKGALKIVMSVLSRDHAEISDDSTARQTFTLQFRHPPSCHVLNRSTARHELEDYKPKIELELLIGFKSGDILLHDPIRKSFTKHFNKGKALSHGAVVKLCWHPQQADLFLASFDDTVLYAQNTANNSADIRPASLGGNLFVIDRKRIEDDSVQLPMIADMQRFSIWRNQNANVNPVARWHVSSKPIKDFSFSSNGRYLATASLDGFLRVFDFEAERMLVVYKAYYGGLTCVTWTPDDRYLVLGSEDDALYVCSFDAHDAARCNFVARGKAHHSWISKISCDTWHGKGEGHYRLVSVGQDCRLVLWDFALDALLLPKESRARRNSLRRSSIHMPRPSYLVDPDASESADQGCAPVITCPDDLAALVPLVSYHSAHTAPYSDVLVTPQLLSIAAWGGQLTCFVRPNAPEHVK